MAGIVRPQQPSNHQTPETNRRRRTGRTTASGGGGEFKRERRAKVAKASAARKSEGQTKRLPPVMVRGTLHGDMAIPMGKVSPAERRTRPRRRYDFTLSVPGAEVRLPSVPSLRVSWRLASGLLILFMAFCLYLLLFTPVFQVDVVQVEGLQRLTLEDIYPGLTVTGESIVKVDPAIVEQELYQAFPEFSSIQVKVSLPSKINLFVTERQPVIDWIQDGKETWIDQEGVAFPVRGTPGKLVRVEADGLPQSTPAEVKVGESWLSPQLVGTVLAMGPYLPEGKSLMFNRERGFGWEDPRGWNVFFGKDLDQVDQKLVTYKTLSEQLVNSGIQPSLISMEFLYAPYYRR